MVADAVSVATQDPALFSHERTYAGNALRKMSQPTTIERFLLLGAPHIVAETADFLARNHAEFRILDWDATPDGSSAFLLRSAPALPLLRNNRLLHPHLQRIVTSPGEIDDAEQPTVILDLSLLRAQHRTPVLQVVHELFPNALILSSTLTCTATELAALVGTASSLVGFNGMPGWTSLGRIELAPALQTSQDATARARSIFAQLGIETELVEDRVGLVIPRILATLINEAAFAAMEQIATPEDIDRAVKLGVNYPHGLLEWADMLGLDCTLRILDALFDEYQEPRYRACPLLRQYVRAGWNGKQSGKGFFEYSEGTH
ncbi:MAG: putative 3-hydroxybutyryl-CoA dehydrogenase [Candidatus Kapaibacterium sp.]|nr:MAG: putative 3-hydroxybutyryl-CoA dehydrogenase [Candidatus Kapabacteria bacterium]